MRTKLTVRQVLVNKLIKLISRTPDATIGNSDAWFLVPHAVAMQAKKLGAKIESMYREPHWYDAKDQDYTVYTGIYCFDVNKYIQGMPFPQSHIDELLPNMTVQEQIKTLKERYNLDFDFFIYNDEEEDEGENIFGCLLLNQHADRLDRMFDDIKMIR